MNFAAATRPFTFSAARRRGPIALRIASVLLLASASCHVVDSKDWNLRQLHDNQGHHQYTGALEGDFQFFLRQRIAAPLLSAGSTLVVKSPKHIDDPAGECLDNLIDLEDFDSSDPRVAGLQVEWCSRIAVDDPWKLSRERALLALGRAGKVLDAGLPVGLAPDAQPTGPEALSSALAALIKSARPVIEKGQYSDEIAVIDLDASCQLVENMTLDVEGARRALSVGIDLTRAGGLNNRAMAPVSRMNGNLERTCVRLGLAAGLNDREPLVRAAAIEASVACAGTRVLIPILSQIAREPSSEVLIRVMRLVRKYGLPPAPPDLSPQEQELAKSSWLASIYRILEGRPEGEVRVGAMLALSQVSGAPFRSLREEDWQAWWFARPTGEVPTPDRSGANASGGKGP